MTQGSGVVGNAALSQQEICQQILDAENETTFVQRQLVQLQADVGMTAENMDLREYL